MTDGNIEVIPVIQPHTHGTRFRAFARISRGNGYASTFAANVAALGCGLLSAIATARGLSASDRGVLLAVVLWTTTASALALLGQQEAIVFFAEGAPERAEAARRASRRRAGLQAVFTVALLLPVVAFILHRSAERFALVGVVAVVLVPLNVSTQRALAIARSARLFGTWNAVRIIPAVTYGVTVAFLAATDKLTVVAGVASLVAGSVVCTILSSRLATMANRTSSVNAEHQAGLIADRDIRRYGLTVAVAELPYITNQRLDQLMLGLFLPGLSISVYAVAVSLTTLHMMLASSIDQVLFARLVAHPGDRRALVVRFLVASLALSAAVTAVLIAVAPAVIRVLYGTQYGKATTPGRILLLAAAFLAGSATLTAYAKAVDRVRVVVAAQAVGAVLTLCLLPPAIAAWGILGAAEVSLLTYALILVLLCWRLLRAPSPASRPE